MMLGGFFLYMWLKVYMNVIGLWKAAQEQIWDRHRLPKNLPRGEGKNLVITGGNRGIGFEAVKGFLALGYNVIIGCRNPVECDQKLRDYSGELGSKSYECLELDLTSLESVRAFAKIILDKRIPIHVLANNAGTMFGPRKQTTDGCESQFQVNFLSHVLLTSLLLPRLREAGKAGKKARVLNVSSAAHFAGSWMDFEDLQCRKFYCPEGAYGNSKVAQIMFAKYLDKKLSSSVEGQHVAINCVHPGVVNTDLYQNARWIQILAGFMMKNARQGGDSVLHGCLSPDLEGQGGLYIENSRARTPSRFARDPENQAKLWNLTLKLAAIEEFGM